jgi:two-component system, OmpR family, sensor kinase
VDNAIRYTPDGGRIDLSVVDEPNHVILEIEDSGVGIPEEERERVLDPFYRVLGSDQTGSGLGLSIVKTIAERLQGRIELSESSQFPQGLKARVVLEK